MAVLYHPGFDSTRVYDGTDTRAFGLLFGAALAMVWPSRHLTRPSARARAGSSTGWGRRAGRDRDPDLAHERLLAVPLPGRHGAPVGGDRVRDRRRRSPGHPPRPGHGLEAAAVDRCALLRHLPMDVPDHRAHHAHGHERRRPAARHVPGRREHRRRRAVVAASSRSPSATERSGACGRGSGRAPGSRRRSRVRCALRSASAWPPSSSRAWGWPVQRRRLTWASSPRRTRRGRAGRAVRRQPSCAPTAATTPTSTAPSHGTSCKSVVHIGDSTSEGLVSRNYLPKRSERIEARMRTRGSGKSTWRSRARPRSSRPCPAAPTRRTWPAA